MQYPTLIKHSCTPKDNQNSHLSTIAGKKNEMALVGFVNEEPQEQEVYDFSEDFIHY